MVIHSNCGTNKLTSPTMREAWVIYGRSSLPVTVRAHLPNCADRFWSLKPFPSGTYGVRSEKLFAALCADETYSSYGVNSNLVWHHSC
jgi:hypothetical protein